MAGLTATGIDILTLDEVLSAIEADELANIDANLNLQPDDVLGQLNGIFAAAVGELWELLEEIYQSAFADTATGQSLSYIAALTGIIRQPATKSELVVNLVGTPSTAVPAGTQGYVPDDSDSVYETQQLETIGGGGSVIVTMKAVTPGTTTRAFVSDGGLTIATPVSGLSLMLIQADHTAGTDEETDAELRLRREQSLAIAGASTVEAIRADMLTVTGVDSCTVFENRSPVTDAFGLPPHSIEVIVNSTQAPTYTAQDVIDQLWLSKPAGTETYGGESGTATDSLGGTHTVYYSEPTTVVAHVAVTLTAATDGSYVGNEAVRTAIVTWATANLRVGDDFFASDVVNVVADLTGVISVDVTNTFVDDTDPPTTTTLVAGSRELVTVTSTNIDVTS